MLSLEGPCRAHRAPLPQANNVAHKLQHANGASLAVSASALGSKDSLYTIQDAPAAPTHRITAAPSQVGGWSASGGVAWRHVAHRGCRPRQHAAAAEPLIWPPAL